MRILLVRAGGPVAPAPPETVQDLAHWFGGEPVDMDVVRPRRGESLPSPDGYDAFVVSGSPCSLTEPEPWMIETTRYVRDLVERDRHLLGVCFGHQMIGLAMGGRVVKNPRGRVMGTLRVQLTAEGKGDPLFRGLGGEIAVHTTHQDIVVDTPPELVCLATSETASLQAFRFGRNVRGVQFHPELDEHKLTKLANSRAEAIDREGVAAGLAPGEGLRRILDSIVSTRDGRAILRNFVAIVHDSMPATAREAALT